MKKIFFVRILLAFAVLLGGCTGELGGRDVVYQTSVLNALLDGAYDGDVTFGELKRHGDFGIGTFNGLDGEMLGLDGGFYQVKADGKAYTVGDGMMTPFAVVTFFECDRSLDIDREIDFEDTKALLDRTVDTVNIFHAIRIDGDFSYMKTRSVPRQEKPYPPLVEVTKHQPVFEFREVSGTIVGFRSPDYVGGINVPGYHFHFITDDRTAGGHVLEFTLTRGTVLLDSSSRFFMALPSGGEFYSKNLSDDRSGEIEKVEK